MICCYSLSGAFIRWSMPMNFCRASIVLFAVDLDGMLSAAIMHFDGGAY